MSVPRSTPACFLVGGSTPEGKQDDFGAVQRCVLKWHNSFMCVAWLTPLCDMMPAKTLTSQQSQQQRAGCCQKTILTHTAQQYRALLLGNKGLFCGNKGLLCGYVRLFCGCIGLFCSKLRALFRDFCVAYTMRHSGGTLLIRWNNKRHIYSCGYIGLFSRYIGLFSSNTGLTLWIRFILQHQWLSNFSNNLLVLVKKMLLHHPCWKKHWCLQALKTFKPLVQPQRTQRRRRENVEGERNCGRIDISSWAWKFGLQLNHKELCESCLCLEIVKMYMGFIDKHRSATEVILRKQSDWATMILQTHRWWWLLLLSLLEKWCSNCHIFPFPPQWFGRMTCDIRRITNDGGDLRIRSPRVVWIHIIRQRGGVNPYNSPTFRRVPKRGMAIPKRGMAMYCASCDVIWSPPEHGFTTASWSTGHPAGHTRWVPCCEQVGEN